MKGAAEAGLEVPQHGVDPPELRQVVGVLSTGDHCLVLAVGRCHGPEAGEAIGQHLTAGGQYVIRFMTVVVCANGGLSAAVTSQELTKSQQEKNCY